VGGGRGVMNFQDWQNLDELINPAEECPLPNGGQPAAGGAGPGAIGGGLPLDDAVIPKPKRVEDQSIWDEDEVDEDDGLVIDPSDKRKRPEYEILYKQEVSANDCFLGLDMEKDVGTTCCNEIVVKITLPGETMKDLDLDVQKTRLTVQSRKHILPLPLPYPVDHKNGSAKWDGAKSLLSVTLPLLREELGGGR
jgi:HSP20 family molecular chaperone IbpA